MSDEATRLYRRNPFLRVRAGKAIECDLLLDGRTFELPSPALVGVIAAMTGTRTLQEFSRAAEQLLDDQSQAPAVIRALAHAGILVDADKPWPEMAAVEHWIERGWLDALVFHLRARSARFDDDAVADPSRLHETLLRQTAEEGITFWEDVPGPAVSLPSALPCDALPPLGEVLLRRRSNQPWVRGTATLTELSTLLYHSSAETRRLRSEAEACSAEIPGALLNSAFSALEVYVAAFAVEGLEPGFYHYQPHVHGLTLIRGGDLRAEFVTMCAGQPRAGGGAATIVIGAVWERYFMRYRHAHAYRVLMVNAGELGQKILLFATALGFSTFLTPAFDEQVADVVLGFDPVKKSAIEAIGVG